MKKCVKVLLLIVLGCCSLCVLTSCRNASQYADDIWRAVDDKIDDGIRIKSPKIKKMPKKKTCRTCHGSGIMYDVYGNRHECSNCGGDGEVWLDF